MQHYAIQFVSDLRQVSGLFSPGPRVSSINKTDHYDIAEILLKVTFNTINLNLQHAEYNLPFDRYGDDILFVLNMMSCISIVLSDWNSPRIHAHIALLGLIILTPSLCSYFLVCLRVVVSNTFCVVFYVLFVFVLCLMYPMLSLSLGCPFFLRFSLTFNA
jgi:hypothetical protein